MVMVMVMVVVVPWGWGRSAHCSLCDPGSELRKGRSWRTRAKSVEVPGRYPSKSMTVEIDVIFLITTPTGMYVYTKFWFSESVLRICVADHERMKAANVFRMQLYATKVSDTYTTNIITAVTTIYGR